MNKNYSKSTKAIVDAQVDPTLFDSNCYYKPKVNKKSEAMANQGRARLQQKYSQVAMMHGSGHDDLALAARQNLLGEVANGDLGQSVELVDKIGSVGMLDEEGEQQQSFAESFSQDEREETNQSRSMQPPTDDHLVEQRERNAEMLLQEDASITIIQNFPQPKTKPTSALSVSEHLYQATLVVT